jgi:hypothetical protein
MDNIVHIETRIVTLLGVVDNEGNVTQIMVSPDNNNPNDPLLVKKLTVDNFTKAFNTIGEIREKLKCQQLEQ